MSSRMTRWRMRAALALAGATAVVAVATVVASWGALERDARTDDRNRDGRPDIWRSYDGNGRIGEVGVDSNFDGRSDVREYYEAGVLVRRESDRDFNDRIDLVQEFDPTTGDVVRSVADVNFDGVADLLVLFHDGREVYSKQTDTTDRPGHAPDRPAASTERASNDPLAPLDDPFSKDLAIKAVRHGDANEGGPALSTPGGLPQPSVDLTGLACSSRCLAFTVTHLSTVSAGSFSPRAPPVLHRLS